VRAAADVAAADRYARRVMDEDIAADVVLDDERPGGGVDVRAAAGAADAGFRLQRGPDRDDVFVARSLRGGAVEDGAPTRYHRNPAACRDDAAKGDVARRVQGCPTRGCEDRAIAHGHAAVAGSDVDAAADDHVGGRGEGHARGSQGRVAV